MNNHIEKTIKTIEDKILSSTAEMRRLKLHDMEVDGHIRLINKLKETKEVLEILEDIK